MIDGSAGRGGTEGPEGSVLASALVELAHAAVRAEDTVDVLMLISERTVELLPVVACGVLVRDPGGTLRAVASSSAAAEVLDLFQAQAHEGPCVECITTGAPVTGGAADVASRWPEFGRLLAAESLAAVHAAPILARDRGLGALNLFGDVLLGRDDRELAQALADLAGLALLKGDLEEDAVSIVRRLHIAVQSRATLAQATGVAAERLGVTPDAALQRLKDLARVGGTGLTAAATAVLVRDRTVLAALDALGAAIDMAAEEDR